MPPASKGLRPRAIFLGISSHKGICKSFPLLPSKNRLSFPLKLPRACRPIAIGLLSNDLRGGRYSSLFWCWKILIVRFGL